MYDDIKILFVIFSSFIISSVGFDQVFGDQNPSINIIATPQSEFNFLSDSDAAIGIDNYPIVAYWEIGTIQDLRVVHCTSIDCSVKDSPISLGVVGTSGPRPSISIGMDGFPIISYHVSLPGVDHIEILHCTNVDCSTFDSPIIIDNTPSSSDTSISIGMDGFPVVSYADEFSVAKLQFVHCTSTNCSTFDSPRILDSDTRVGTSSTVLIGSDGYPIISYAVINNPGVRVLHCTSVDCSTFEPAQTLDISSTGIFEVEMTLGSDGFPVLSYNEVHLGQQRILHCTSINCSTYNPPVIVDSGSFSPFSSSVSIILGKDNFPVTSYIAEAFELRLVHCTIMDCSTFESPKILDIEANFPTSIAIGFDGFPVISYGKDSGIFLVHCPSVNCDSVNNVPPNNPPVCEDTSDKQEDKSSFLKGSIVETSSISTTIKNVDWPPFHNTVEIILKGITDVDGDSISFNIDSITQDEPNKGLGKGDKSPDGFGVGTETASIRVERDGGGDGRVYEISFTADDGKGGQCSSSRLIGVPHDKAKAPVNSGQIYDSFQ